MRLASRLAGVSALVVGVALGPLVPPAGAQLRLTASRPELLYSATGDPDCSTLSKEDDRSLPWNMVRLRATLPGVDPAAVRYQWSFPKPKMGTLLADLDLRPGEQTAAVRGLCVEFGNACILTEEKLRFYNYPTILWAAPDCTVLPDNTSRPFRGGAVNLGVAAFEGRRKLGKQRIQIGWGRIGSLTLFVDGRTGLGKGVVTTSLGPVFNAILDRGGERIPPVLAYNFETGLGASLAVPPEPCGLGADVCSPTVQAIYSGAGKAIPAVQTIFTDFSFLCDKNTLRIGEADNKARLVLDATPKSRVYVPNDPRRGTVNLKVTLVDQSVPPRGGLFFVGTILSCQSDIQVGNVTDTRFTTFSLRRCSETVAACDTNDQCPAGEFCLNQSYCRGKLTQPCTNDSDCQPPLCPTCTPHDTCVRVLEVSSLHTRPGDRVTLVDTTVNVANAFPANAVITDTWTLIPFNAPPAKAKMRYRIRKGPKEVQ